MLRETLKNHRIGMNQEFRNRGEEQTRIESFSDAVFALAITLLLISSKPPSNFNELREFTSELIPFAICITLLSLIWWEHFIFFLRYGFRNSRVVFYNILLLFIVLFYVYPLKFLAKFIVLLTLTIFDRSFWLEAQSMANVQDVPWMMIIYGLGAASIFSILALMYRYAYKRRLELELDEIEQYDTKTSIRTNVLMASVPILSCILAFIFRNSIFAGMVSGFAYFLYTPIMIVHGKLAAKGRLAIMNKDVIE